MNKKFIGLSLLSTTCIAAIGVGFAVQSEKKNLFGALASPDCEWHSYEKVDPTFSTAGHRKCWVCCAHHETVFEEPGEGIILGAGEGVIDDESPAYLPELTDLSYDRSSTITNRIVTKVWKKGDYKAAEETSNAKGGVIKVYDNDAGEWLWPEEFNSRFDGIEMSFNGKDTTTLNVTKQDGLVLNDIAFEFDANLSCTLKIDGNPLTVNYSKNDREAIKAHTANGPSSGNSITLQINNDTKVFYTGTVASSKSGVNVHGITVNKGKSFAVKGFNNALYVTSKYGNNYNGEMNLFGTDKAVSGSATDRTVKLGSGMNAFGDHIKLSSVATNGNLTGKHVVITSASDVDSIVDTKLTVAVEPTTSSTGELSVSCADCGHPIAKAPGDEIVLPILNESNYDVVEFTKQIDSSTYYKGYKYMTKKEDLSTFGELIFTNITDESVSAPSTKNIIIGTEVYTVENWNKRFPKAIASTSNSGSNLIITLDGETNIAIPDIYTSGSDKAALFLSGWSKVTFAGSGTLAVNVLTSSTIGFRVAELAVNEGAKLILNGASSSGTGSSSNCGVHLRSSATISGELEISNFPTGIYKTGTTNCSIVIQQTGKVNIYDVTCGINIARASSYLTQKGNLVINSSSYSIYNGEYTGQWCSFEGESYTNLTAPAKVLYSSNNSLAVTIKGNAEFNATTTSNSQYQYGIDNLKSFIIGEDGGNTACNAVVNLKSNNNDLFNAANGMTLIVNSNKETTFTNTNASSGKSVIAFQKTKTYVCKILSNVTVNNYQFAFYFNETAIFGDGDFVYDEANPKIKMSNDLSGGTAPANITKPTAKRS